MFTGIFQDPGEHCRIFLGRSTSKSTLRSDLLEHIKLYFMYNKKMFAYAHIYLST